MDKPKLVNVKADNETEKVSMEAISLAMQDQSRLGIDWPHGHVLVVMWNGDDGRSVILSAGALDALRESGVIPEETFRRVTSPTRENERWIHLTLHRHGKLWFRTALVLLNRPGEVVGWNPTVGQA